MDRKRRKIAILVIIAIFWLTGANMGAVFPATKIAQAKEIGPNKVQGKVVSIQTNVFRRGTIVLKSDQTGKSYTVYVGSRTIYYPRRYPSIGETIKVRYINDRGYLKAEHVEIVQGP